MNYTKILNCIGLLQIRYKLFMLISHLVYWTNWSDESYES